MLVRRRAARLLAVLALVGPGAVPPVLAGAAAVPTTAALPSSSGGGGALDVDPIEMGTASPPSDPAVLSESVRRHRQMARSASGELAQAPRAASTRGDIAGYRTSDYPARGIEPGQRAYEDAPAAPLVDTGVHDGSGVRMFLVGGQQYDHPVAQAQYGLDLLNTYRLTGDQRFLDRATAQAQRLVDRRVESDGAWFYPYPFDFALHGRTVDTLRAPWYSAMAQGQALSLFVRLAEVTHASAWSAAADATAASLQLGPTTDQPAVARVADDGFLWFDEFPRSSVDAEHPQGVGPDLTFNGHVFAALGLYDYVRATGDPAAAAALDGALTTSRHLVNLIRDPRWMSRYCLLHPSVRSQKYHGIHQEQLLLLHGITGDAGFALYADAYRDDYPTDAVSGTVRLGSGRRTGYQFDAAGRVVRSTTISLSRASSAPTNARTRIRGGALHYRVTAGSLKGTWVAEQYGTQSLNGFTSRHDYRLARTVTVAAGQYSAYSFTSTGAVTSYRSLRLTATSSTTADATAWINGRQHAHVVAGAWAGLWLPLVSGVKLT